MDFNSIDRKKTGIVIITVAVVLLCVTLYVWYSSRGGSVSDEQTTKSVMIDTPEGNAAAVADSRIDAFGRKEKGRSAISDYWDEIGRETEEEDIYADGGDDKAVTAEDMFRSIEEQQRAEAERMEAERREREDAKRADRERVQAEARARVVQDTRDLTQMQIDMMKEQGVIKEENDEEGGDGKAEAGVASLEEEVRDRIDVQQVRVSKSSGISSLDGGTGLGSATRDDFVSTDSRYPFKCQFVREEKITGGQRVSIRLLEDMVVDGVLVPRNTHLMATCSIGKRLDLSVTSVEINGRMYNLNYHAYDNDGTKGIYCPDVEERLKQEAERVGRNAARRAGSGWGRLAQDVLDMGLSVAQQTKSGMVVCIPKGYMFYLVKAKEG